MPRVASLYLPYLATERIANAARREGKFLPDPGSGRGTAPARRGGGENPAPSDCPSTTRLREQSPSPGKLGEEQTVGWRPGSRWARSEQIARIEADIAALPLHQRPPMRELGRRSEAVATPFRAMPPDEMGGLRQTVRDFPAILERGRSDRDAGGTRRTPSTKPGGYDREGAFWQSAHAIAGEVRHRWDPPGAARRPGPSAAPPREGPPPLVTAIRDGNRMVIAAACPVAQGRHGLAAGQPLATARALVPGLDVRDADPAGDHAALHRLALHAVSHWSPIAAVSDPAGLWIDASAAPLAGGEAGLCARILALLARAGHDARIAIADTPGAAHALARHGGARMTLCPPDGQADALAPLPIAALRLETRAAERLRRLGVATIADLAAIARAPLVRRFGRATADRIDEAFGHRPEPIDGVLPPETPQARCRFLEPISTADAIATALTRLVGELCEVLTERGLGARRVALLCRRVDNRDEIETIGAAAATRDPAHLLRLLCARIEKIDPGFGIEAMRLIAPRCDALGPLSHRTLADDAPDLAALVDILATRLGPARLYRHGGIESDVPERSVSRAPALADRLPAHPDWPRPLRLLDRPEALAQVMAELPDHPPIRFRWRDTLHIVAAGDGPERIHGEWWRATCEADAVRDYFAVEDETGRRFWLFRRGDGTDGRTGDMSWHLHGLFGD